MLKSVGVVISHKDGERRRAILPADIIKIRNPKQLFVESGYGNSIGIADEEYLNVGCRIVTRDEALRCDIIMDVKLSDADYLNLIADRKILFGWAHAVQGIDFTAQAIRHRHTVIAWEEITENGRYIFSRNREIAGEAAVMHAFRYSGKMPYDAKTAIIGNGQTARGALRVLHCLGAHVDVFDRKKEQLFKDKMFEYDVLINCVLWDTGRSDRLIYADDLKKMKPGTMIIDISCDPHLEIETSHPTTIDDPVYTVDGVIHYAVDNTPAMYPITVSKVLSDGLWLYLDSLIESEFDDYPESLKRAAVIHSGIIRDTRIREYRIKCGIVDG